MPEGEVRGLRARGGFEVDLAWKGGKLTAATVRSKLGKPLKVRYAGKEISRQTRPGQTIQLDATSF